MPGHLCQGDAKNKVAFILSTPGKFEGEVECPAAGDTSENMNAILVLPNKNKPTHFPNIDRYRYLITNASTKVMHSAKDDNKAEDAERNITEPQNIDRVLMEVKHCTIVILCGQKANLLTPHLSEKVLIRTSHLGNKGLRNKFKNDDPSLKGLITGKERDTARLNFVPKKFPINFMPHFSSLQTAHASLHNPTNSS